MEVQEDRPGYFRSAVRSQEGGAPSSDRVLIIGIWTNPTTFAVSIMSLEAKLQDISGELQKLQSLASKAIEARERLDAQLSENELVKKEFADLTEDNTVYKLLGPVLVKQDQAEAKSTVNTRLDFIRSEIKRVETQIKDLDSQMDKKKDELGSVQTAIQTRDAQNASGAQ